MIVVACPLRNIEGTVSYKEDPEVSIIHFLRTFEHFSLGM